MKVLIKPEEFRKLAPMPASVTRLAQVTCDPAASVTDIAAVIEFDQALAANSLRLANSAWAGARRKIETVKDAVMMLGVSQILALVIGGRVSKAMKLPCKGYDLAERELWRHSVAAALASEKMKAVASKPVPGAAFTASLLHDIGKLVLSRHIDPATAAEIRTLAAGKALPYYQAEREVLGTDHAVVGGGVAREWKFPASLVNAIERHHDPDAAPDPILDAVHISNAVAKLIGVGLGSEEMNMTVSSQASARMGISPLGLELLCAEVADGLEAADNAWRGVTNGAKRSIS
jgi:putative nucleotidyltransferase with HDIG domain